MTHAALLVRMGQKCLVISETSLSPVRHDDVACFRPFDDPMLTKTRNFMKNTEINSFVSSDWLAS